MWAGLAVPVYTPCILRGALHFFNKTVLTYLKKKRIPVRNAGLLDAFFLVRMTKHSCRDCPNELRLMATGLK
jgi:hypothetical protein